MLVLKHLLVTWPLNSSGADRLIREVYMIIFLATPLFFFLFSNSQLPYMYLESFPTSQDTLHWRTSPYTLPFTLPTFWPQPWTKHFYSMWRMTENILNIIMLENQYTFNRNFRVLQEWLVMGISDDRIASAVDKVMDLSLASVTFSFPVNWPFSQTSSLCPGNGPGCWALLDLSASLVMQLILGEQLSSAGPTRFSLQKFGAGIKRKFATL